MAIGIQIVIHGHKYDLVESRLIQREKIFVTADYKSIVCGCSYLFMFNQMGVNDQTVNKMIALAQSRLRDNIYGHVGERVNKDNCYKDLMGWINLMKAVENLKLINIKSDFMIDPFPPGVRMKIDQAKLNDLLKTVDVP